MQTTGGQRSKSRVAVARRVNSRMHYRTHCHGESRFEDQNKNTLRLSAVPALVCVFASVLQLHFCERAPAETELSIGSRKARPAAQLDSVPHRPPQHHI